MGRPACDVSQVYATDVKARLYLLLADNTTRLNMERKFVRSDYVQRSHSHIAPAIGCITLISERTTSFYMVRMHCTICENVRCKNLCDRPHLCQHVLSTGPGAFGLQVRLLQQISLPD